MISYYEPNFIENSFGKAVFHIFTEIFTQIFTHIFSEIEMTRNENWLFGRHFETVNCFNIFFFFCLKMVVFSVWILCSICYKILPGKSF